MYLLWQISVGHLPGRGNARPGYVWSGKCPSVMCLVGEVSVGDVSGKGSVRRGFVWLGKCLSGMCLVGEVSIGNVSGWGNVCRGSVRRGRVRRGNACRGCVQESVQGRFCIGLHKVYALNLLSTFPEFQTDTKKGME